ncbi:hypothetical protein, partial [Staphylococcus edaphicus]|uniref:hypothetical protein n=1 Tax=Staphylococcus edaphicus TaxID=1955013 RepID=UPI003B75C162
IRKIVAQRATKLYKNKENVNFYIISIEIDVYSLIRNVYVPDSYFFFIIFSYNCNSFSNITHFHKMNCTVKVWLPIYQSKQVHYMTL